MDAEFESIGFIIDVVGYSLHNPGGGGGINEIYDKSQTNRGMMELADRETKNTNTCAQHVVSVDARRSSRTSSLLLLLLHPPVVHRRVVLLQQV